MCGICGIIQPIGQSIHEPEFRAMGQAIRHRGPDAEGHYLDGHIALGHQRLKIIDLSEAARQPMTNEDGSIVVVFNGEIYNFQALRTELEQHGHQFRSRSDTEVIVHGYEQWGKQCVERFNGMFAFAIYDKKCREIFLARDPLGIKPLYYFASPAGVLFASEIKAFLGCRAFTPKLNESALTEYFLYRSLAGRETLFHNVHALLPGHWLRIRPDLTYTEQAYWDIPFDQPRLPADSEHLVLDRLTQSVAMQEMSDVPIGAQLSGGTDSSLVTALMAQRSQVPIRTFSVGFQEKDYSELSYAKTAAQYLKTDHQEIFVNHNQFAEALDTLTWQQDEPLMHANSAGIYWLSKYAKSTVTVLLSGDGADETFAGYYRYDSLRKSMLAKRWLFPAAPFLPAQPQGHKLRRLKQALTNPLRDLIITSTANGLAAFGKHLDARPVIEKRAEILTPVHTQSWLTQALYYDLKTYLPPILMRQDKMSMASGLETRVPFLDHELVELAFRLPDAAKLRAGQSKLLLKQIASRYLPAELIHRPKVGFEFPLKPWLRSDHGLGERLSLVTDPNGLARRFLPKACLDALLKEHRAKSVDHTEPLWTLLALEIWYRRFFSQTPRTSRLVGELAH